ncbi:MAG: flotillin family protein [Candidatus Eremiobacteraeota bacterium]|nr:flotillin family protein [Candidatus Eremiobacteraeota bacterium]
MFFGVNILGLDVPGILIYGPIALVMLGFFGLITVVVFKRFYIKVEQGTALLINKMGDDPEVVFTGGLVYPVIHKAELMDISVKTIHIDRRGQEGLICKDNIRADIRVSFYVKVNKSKADVVKVAQLIGCQRASNIEVLDELFTAKFSEALKTVGKKMEFEELYTKREDFRDMIIQVIGQDLNGYSLEDAAIDYLEQTPVENLDRENILDAQGIRKITELTTLQHIQTNHHNREAEKQIKEQDTRAREKILELERQEKDAEAEQARQIAVKQAAERSAIEVAQQTEREKAEIARARADEKIAIEEENKMREIEVAQKNRERMVAIEEERVEKDRQLEAITRERETELQRIAKERALEEEKKLIQDVIRERIAVEKTVAEEEERIKELRVVEAARRNKEAKVIAAEAQAQELVIQDVKAAEAAEQVARHKAKEQLTAAEAELEVADKRAQAKIRLSEGLQAEVAAQGLAEARVKEALAQAREKEGMAEVRVKEAEAPANEALGLAEVKVEQARHETDAHGIRLKLMAEAEGIAKKAEAMKALDEASKEHEEFRLRLENQRIIALEQIRINKEIAEAQAMVMSEAFRSANIDIIGGDGVFIDKIMNAASLGKSLDAFVSNGEAGRAMVGDYLNGERSLPEDLQKILTNPSLSTGDLKNLTLSRLLNSLASGAEGADRTKMNKLIEAVSSMGLGEMTIGADS